jgi:hypothetical protein
MQVLCGFRKGVQKNTHKNKISRRLAGGPGAGKIERGDILSWLLYQTTNFKKSD